ncbi:MAG: lactate utilization protein [Planctomycetes bacterium]|nr:lactate utilization protein [Planctomycetota bacterium]
MKAQDFLARVRTAAATGRQYPVAYDKDIPPTTGYYGAGDAPVDRFIAEANLVGGQAVSVANDDEARQTIVALLSQYSAQRALCWQHPLLDRLRLDELLDRQGVPRFDYDALAAMPADERRKTMMNCDIGITSCSYAVAETGSLVMLSEPGRERVASLLSTVHIAVIERSQLLPDLFDVFERIQPDTDGRLPSNVTFITGPSKTGDLELRLVTGVHGPKYWHVIVIDEPTAV